jgi:hypothetical protein
MQCLKSLHLGWPRSFLWAPIYVISTGIEFDLGVWADTKYNTACKNRTRHALCEIASPLVASSRTKSTDISYIYRILIRIGRLGRQKIEHGMQK